MSFQCRTDDRRHEYSDPYQPSTWPQGYPRPQEYPSDEGPQGCLETWPTISQPHPNNSIAGHFQGGAYNQCQPHTQYQTYPHNDYTHVNWLEDRLKKLEERMCNMDQVKEPEARLKVDTRSESSKEPGSGTQETVESDRLPAIAEIRYVRWTEFKNRFSLDESRYAVEVLMAGSNLKEEIRQERVMRQSESKSEDTLKITDTLVGKVQVSSQANEQWAHRIRINSLPILSLLAKARGESWANEIHTFFRPFFLLRSVHGSLKEILKELELKWGQTEPESSSDEVKKKDALEFAEVSLEPAAKGRKKRRGKSKLKKPKGAHVAPSATKIPESSEQGRPIAHDETSDGSSLTDSVEALRDLRCYVKFMDAEIIPLEKQFESTSCRKIRYEDLAYLFSPGDEVYAPVACEISASGFSKSPLVCRYQTLWRLYGINTPEFQRSDFDEDGEGGYYDREEGQVSKKEWEPTIYNHFAVWCYYIDFDGKSFGAVRHVHRIRPFEGERDITSLPCYPLRFKENHRDYRQKLKSLGEKYQEYLSLKHLSYTGSTLICNPTGDKIDDTEGKLLKHPSHVDSDIIVDFEETFQIHPNWRCTFHVPMPGQENIGPNTDNFMLRRWADRQRKALVSAKTEIIHTRDHNRLRNELIREDAFLVGYKKLDQQGPEARTQKLGGDDLVLLPRRLFAYILRERKFAQVDVEYVRSAAGKIDSLTSLELPLGHKEMVQALVDTHFKKRNIGNPEYGEKLDFDIVQGKGRGLIILLHGVPGVGKTSTAECVAETNKKPLFSITCGDLGFSPAEVESSLSEIFRLAHLWDCVLLLDEADVFLAQRTKQDLNRNALVSVFLRILEYYEGILFLTTNRVGTFDEAFKSRIHMSLYYPPLARDQTLAIWDMNIDRAQKIDAEEVRVTKQLAMTINRKRLKKFAAKHYEQNAQGRGRWNGRQIRNAFQIATALAHYRAERENEERANTSDISDPDHRLPIAPTLSVDLFERVASATLDFDNYMTETAGFTDADLAHAQGDRADHHYFPWQARDTGSHYYNGEEYRETPKSKQSQKMGTAQAYTNPYTPQADLHRDQPNQNRAQNLDIFGPRTDTSSQKSPTPLSAKSAPAPSGTPTSAKTAELSSSFGKSAEQDSDDSN